MASASAYLLLFLSLPFLAAAQSPTPAPTAAPPAAVPNPVEILTKGGRFGTLLKLLTDANLVPAIADRLTSGGISIFAPSDAAFKKISSVTAKLSKENITTILLYHALDKYVTFSDLDSSSNPFETLAPGLTLNFTGGDNDRNVTTGVTNTKVEAALYDATPLAIFPVEDVLIPPTFAAPPSPVEILTNDGRFGTLLKLLTDANLVTAIAGRLASGGISIFAPTDAAFKKIASVTANLSSDNITTILLYHGLDKYVTFSDLDSSDNPFKTLAPGLTLNFTGGDGNRNVTTGVTNTKVEKALYDASPLAIFPVEDVLIPPTFAKGTAAAPPKAAGPTAATPGTPQAAPPQLSAAGMERVGWGALMGGVIACMSLF